VATGAASPSHPAEPIRFRRGISTLSADQLAIFRQAFQDVMDLPDADDRGYQHWAGFHGLPGRIECDQGHFRPEFLPWHRAYLFRFEQALKDRQRQLHGSDDVMLSFWDWRRPTPDDPGHIPKAFDDQTVDGKPNPLFSAKVNPIALQQAAQLGELDLPGDHTFRDPGRAVDQNGRRVTLPTVAEVDQVLQLTEFTRFSSGLENLHGRVHMWVGGHMGEIPFASYDPIFWAHHTMIDRIWRKWQLSPKGSDPPSTILNESMRPFGMTVADQLEPPTHGYDYTFATRSAPMRPA
jgi:tyrosinase